MTKTLYCLTYNRWFLDRNGDWDFERCTEEFADKEFCERIAVRRLSDNKVSRNSIKTFSREVSDQHYQNFLANYD